MHCFDAGCQCNATWEYLVQAVLKYVDVSCHSLCCTIRLVFAGKQAAAQMGTDRYVWSVTPCLMAWPAVVMAPGPASLAIASVLAVVHAVDGRFAGQKLLPQWYMVLRRPLSAFAISGMLITLVGSFVYSEAQAQQTKPRQQENLEA